MKILIVVCIIIMLLLGFVLFNIITSEIDEAQVSRINTIDVSTVEDYSVDKLEQKHSYSQRVSTYTQPSSDLVKAASNLDFDSTYYASIIYFEDDQLIHEEYALEHFELIEVGKIKGECIVVIPVEETLKSNIDENKMVIYNLENSIKMIHLKPNQTGQYQLSTDQVKIEFHIIKK